MSESPNLPPLLRLPMELRLSILKYLLPLDTEGHKTITMRLYEGLRHRDLANLHVEKTYPSRHALSRYLMGVGMVNHKLHADTLTLLYSRTFIIRITEDSSPRTYDCRNWFQYAHQYRRNGWRAFLPGLDLARIKALKIQIEPSNCPGTWPGVHRRMDMFCRMLGRSIGDQELKRLVVEITDTKTSGVELGSRWDDGIGAQDPVEATVEDVIGILQSAWRFIGDVKACEIKMPEWASTNQLVNDAAKETREAVCLSWSGCARAYEVGDSEEYKANEYQEDEEKLSWSEEERESEELESESIPCRCNDCVVERRKGDQEPHGRDYTTEEIWDDENWYLTSWEPRQKELWDKSMYEKWDDFYSLPPLM